MGLCTATEIDKQGSTGYCFFTKLDATTGELIWQNKIKCRKLGSSEKPIEGGMFATPLFGHGNCEGLIFTNICGLGTSDVGTFIAISRKTGEIVYRTRLSTYAWSSPVAFYTPDERMYVFTGDIYGNAYLIDAKSGKIIFKQTMANNFESSPVVVGNSLVVGSRGREIYRFEII
jgi:outer membrane protein assembly factor BamB